VNRNLANTRWNSFLAPTLIQNSARSLQQQPKSANWVTLLKSISSLSVESTDREEKGDATSELEFLATSAAVEILYIQVGTQFVNECNPLITWEVGN